MKLVTILAALWGVTGVMGAEGVPELVSVGSYSVTLRLPGGMWAVESFPKAEVIRYSYADEANRSALVFHLTVYRIRLRPDRANLEGSELAKRLVEDDEVNFKKSEFGRIFHFRFKPDRLEVPGGTAYIYSSEGAAFSDPVPHYADVGLLLPIDYRSRRVAYLVVGHQMKSRVYMAREQREYLKLILEGLKELANKAPEPTPGSATPRAIESKSK